MKKLFLLTAAAAAMAATMVSCESGGSGHDPVEGREARMDVRISFPRTPGVTRDDATDTASEKDVTIESITVFIFDEEGSSVRGNGTTFDNIDADFTIENNTYKMNAASRIQTVAGPKHVYVGINLPAGLKGATTEADLTEKAAGVTGLETDTSVAMLSALATPDLVAVEAESGGGFPSENTVSMEVKRLVSKITVTMGDATDETFGMNDGIEGDATYEIIPAGFVVNSVATKFYPVERLVDGELTTPADVHTDAEPTYLEINDKGTDIKDFTAVYVPEHADMSGSFFAENLTHVMVRAEIVFTKWADSDEGKIKYDDITGSLAERNVYVYRYGDYTYFCESPGKVDNIKAVFNDTDPKNTYTSYRADAEGKLYTYYPIFFNELDNYTVYRNQFFDIRVTGAKGLGIKTPDVPPETPLIKLAQLEVEVNVLEWDYEQIPYELGE